MPGGSWGVVLAVLVGYWVWEFFQGEECPDCGAARLGFRAHRNVGGGGDSWAYFACSVCGARVKQRPDGPYEGVDPEEWSREVGG